MKKTWIAGAMAALLAMCSISISAFAASNSIELEVHDTYTLSVSVNEGQEKDVQWQTNARGIATVSKDGVVTASNRGNATITAVLNDEVIGEWKFTINEKKSRKVELSSDTLTVRVNQTRMISAYIEPYDASFQDVHWESSNHEIVTFVDDGVIQGVSPGTATITATAPSGRVGTCVVTVPGTPLKGLADDPDSVQLSPNSSTGATVSAATIKADTEKALDSSTSQQISLTYLDKSTVSTAALRGAQHVAGLQSRSVKATFTTSQAETASNDIVFYSGDSPQLPSQGKLEIDAANVPTEDKDIAVGIYTEANRVSAALAKAKQQFGENTAVIELAHKGAYGMQVSVSAPTGFTTADASSLKLYRYSGETDSYSQVEVAFTINDAGTVRFSTEIGGTYVVTARK